MPNFIFNYKQKPEIILVRFFSILELKHGIFCYLATNETTNESPRGYIKTTLFSLKCFSYSSENIFRVIYEIKFGSKRENVPVHREKGKHFATLGMAFLVLKSGN